MAYPRRLLTDDEEIIREFRPHWHALMMSGVWLVVGLALIVAGAWAFDGVWAWIAAVAGIGIAFVLALPGFVSWWFRLYVLTTERLVARYGVLRRGSTELPLESINHVRFSQRIVERMLGYGDVLIESAGETGQSILSDIPDPEGFQSEVYRAREARSLALQGPAHVPGGSDAPRDAVAQLESLAALHEKGLLTDDEFQAQKSKLLGQI
jgi:membrane protein YdbS with pleckstrin-like domain